LPNKYFYNTHLNISLSIQQLNPETSIFAVMENSITMPSSWDFTLGEQFISFEELERKISLFKDRHCFEMYLRDARTIEAAKRQTPLKAEIIAPEVRN